MARAPGGVAGSDRLAQVRIGRTPTGVPPVLPSLRTPLHPGHDVALLAEVDEACGQLSGPAAKVLLRRMLHVCGDARFERLADISNGHVHSIRVRRAYRTGRVARRGAKATPVSIAARRKPQSDGKLGHLRVDTMRLGDRGKEAVSYAFLAALRPSPKPGFRCRQR